MPPASIPSAISPNFSPSQDQPSIAHSTGSFPLSVRSCPLPESTRYGVPRGSGSGTENLAISRTSPEHATKFPREPQASTAELNYPVSPSWRGLAFRLTRRPSQRGQHHTPTGSFLGRLDKEFLQRNIDVDIVEFEIEGGLYVGRAYDARRGAVLSTHPPKFLSFGEGHLQPAVTTGNGAFDRDSSGHSPILHPQFKARVRACMQSGRPHLLLPSGSFGPTAWWPDLQRRLRPHGAGMAGNSPVYSHGCKSPLHVAELDFTHFKRHKRGNLQYDGTEWRGVSVHRSWRSIVKNPPTPTTSGYAQR